MNSDITYSFSNKSHGHLTTIYGHSYIRDVTTNRAKFFTALDIPYCASALIEHSGRCQLVEDPATEFVEKADALITTNNAITLGVDFADCHPVLLQCVSTKNPFHIIRAIVHCSRQSLICDVLANTLGHMQDLGAVYENTSAIIGPGLCAACHEIEEDFHDQDALDKVPFHISSSSKTHLSIDMISTIRNILTVHHIPLMHIHCINVCTKCTSTYYSYRGGDSKDDVIRNNLAVIRPHT